MGCPEKSRSATTGTTGRSPICTERKTCRPATATRPFAMLERFSILDVDGPRLAIRTTFKSCMELVVHNGTQNCTQTRRLSDFSCSSSIWNQQVTCLQHRYRLRIPPAPPLGFVNGALVTGGKSEGEQGVTCSNNHVLFAVEFVGDRAVGLIGCDGSVPEGFPGG
jgi:hypothetical protein